MVGGLKHPLRSLPVSRRFRRRAKAARLRAATKLGYDRYTWAALYSMDRRLVALMKGRRGGRFLEVGANDGLQQSNTLALERLYGWTGVLIEASPALAAECRRNRPGSQVVCAAVGRGPGVTLVSDGDLVARTGSDRGSAVGQLPISTVLDAVGPPGIDFMSLDVEGAELDALAGLDLDRHRPAYLLVETAQPEDVATYLGMHYHLAEQWSYHDFLFIAYEATRAQ